MSRTRKFTTEFLKSIVDEYIEENQIGQIVPADLARYVAKKYKLIPMDDKNGGRFFLNDDKVMEYIDGINHDTPNYLKKDGNAMIEISPEKFLKLDSKVQLVLLRNFADIHNDLNRKIVTMKAAEVNYKDNIEKLKIENKKLKEKYNEQSKELEKRKVTLKTYKAIKHFIDNVDILEYLKSKGCIFNLNEETFLIILNKMESIIETVLNLNSEIENDVDDAFATNESSHTKYKVEKEMASEVNKLEKPKLIDFIEEKTKKNNGIANILEDFRNKTT